MHKKSTYEKCFKRPFDFIFSLMVFIVLIPLLVTVSILVWIKLGSPILFKQKRPGLNEKIFVLYKFRTMTNKKDSDGALLPDIDRLTRFGKILRSTSIDELPGLVNLIKGDISFVGPRPLLVEYLELYNAEQKKRHFVRPGLTGLAQVNGRNAITWEEKFKSDVYYVDNISFFNDIKIIFKTFIVVLKREGISANNSNTMEKFTGTIFVK